MKQQLLVLMIGLICSSNAVAEKVKGYYVSKTNDTIRVTFNIPIDAYSALPNFVKLQAKIEYFDAADKKKKLTPDLANEIGFDFDSVKIRMLSRKNNLELSSSAFAEEDGSIFLHIVKDGKLKLFKHYSSMNTAIPGTTYAIEKNIMQKNNEDLYKPRLVSFSKDMFYYLYDCKVLAKKIEDKVYRSDDIERIADEYNACK